MKPSSLIQPSQSLNLQTILSLFWRVKLRVGKNHLRSLKKHLYVHAAVGVAVLLFLLVGGLIGFSWLFNWTLQPKQQPFGDPMLKRLVGMVLLAFFSMLTFSNLIIMMTTTYISREVEFYMAQPISHVRLFFCKFGESTLYSSWAFLVLSLPFFIALGGTGVSKPGWSWGCVFPAAPWSFYPITGLLLLPYILIPAATGAVIAMLITTYFPAKRMFRLAFALAVVSVLLGVLTGRNAGISFKFGHDERGDLGRVMSFMGLGDLAWAPSTWLSRGIRSALHGEYQEVLFWGALLYSSALTALQVCYWLVGPLYYRGFCSSRSSGTGQRKRAGGLFRFFDNLFQPLPSAIRSLVVKDLTVFWRDPAQWGQLMVLFGLLFIYVANLGSAAELSRIRISLPMFQSLTTLFNIGATCFVLAILSTRFIYPMLSLEGKQQWVIGLAPLERTRLVWVKYGLCWLSSLALALPVMSLSCYVIKTNLEVTSLSLLTIIFMSLGLNSLAIGLGALMPNFQEDNPARIANGLGGTINVIASLIYIALTVIFEMPILDAAMRRALPNSGEGRTLLFICVAAMILLQSLVIVYPMRLGLRHWRRLEF